MKLFLAVVATLAFTSASLAQNALPPEKHKQVASDTVRAFRPVAPPATGVNKGQNRFPQMSAPRGSGRR